MSTAARSLSPLNEINTSHLRDSFISKDRCVNGKSPGGIWRGRQKERERLCGGAREVSEDIDQCCSAVLSAVWQALFLGTEWRFDNASSSRSASWLGCTRYWRPIGAHKHVKLMQTCRIGVESYAKYININNNCTRKSWERWSRYCWCRWCAILWRYQSDEPKASRMPSCATMRPLLSIAWFIMQMNLLPFPSLAFTHFTLPLVSLGCLKKEPSFRHLATSRSKHTDPPVKIKCYLRN